MQANVAVGESVEIDSKSRDRSIDTSTLSRRTHKKRSEKSRHTTDTASSTATQAAPEPSGFMAFRFILGVALISVIVGIILGKRY